jgi:hypothetical protein
MRWTEAGQPARSFHEVVSFDPVTATIAGAGISAGGGILGGILQSGAAGKAQAQAQQQFQQQRADLAPWRTTGGQALGASADLLGLNGPDAAAAAMGNFQQSPGYQWSMDQGTRAVDAGAAARGMLRSGAEIKAQQTFGTGLADQEFTNYYNRLAGLSSLGESAAAGGAQTAGAAANAALQGGTAQSSIYGNTASGISNAANTLLNNKGFQDWISGAGSTPGAVSISPTFTSNL